MSINELASRASARKAKRKVKLQTRVNNAFGGDYSHLAEASPTYKSDYIKAMNELNVEYDNKFFKAHALKLLKIRGITGNVSDLSDYAFAPIGKIAYLAAKGAFIAPETKTYLDKQIDAIKAQIVPGDAAPVDAAPKRKSIQEYISDNTHDMLAEIDGWMDDRDFSKSISEYMKENGIKAIHNNLVEEKLTGLAKELQALMKKSDEQVVEAYRGVYTAQEVKDFMMFLLQGLKDTKTFISEKISNRKPRKKKAITPEKMVSKLKYNKEGSLDPRKVIGATQVWVYNTKTRKLAVINSIDADGIKFKGSTLIGMDENKSFSKTLRKPESQLAALKSAGKVALRTFMDSINGKALPVKDRINKDMIFVRVDK